jgi:hypothetical protein
MLTRFLNVAQTRRGFLTNVGGGAVLSAAAIALLGKHDALAATMSQGGSPGNDVAILNLVPGNKMVVQLAADRRDRSDIIAYLRQATLTQR